MPKIVGIKSEHAQNIGKKFIINCYLEQGTRPLKFEWRKNGLPLSSNEHYRIETSDEDSGLTIDRVDPFDSGNFSCIVSNTFGSDSQSTSLLVKGWLPLLFVLDVWRVRCF